MKKITDNQITGTIGEDKVGIVVQEKMGYLWRPQTRYDVGYDGEIEIRNEVTKEAIGLIVKVQSKSIQDFELDKDDTFVYTCTPKDFDYWMKTNAPDIVVITKSKTNEMYWSPIKKYFDENPKNKKERKIYFNKKKSIFDRNAKKALEELAVPKNSGLYLPPVQIEETLFSNLVSVKSYPFHLYIAHTEAKDARAIVDALMTKREYGIRQWIMHNKTIYSFSPLQNLAWEGLYDRGTLETYDSSEWAESEDEDKQWIFAALLSKSLGVRCHVSGIRFDSDTKYYYFDTGTNELEKEIKYKSIHKKTTRFVVKAYYSKKDAHNLSYYKHLAFHTRFLKYEDGWYLQINPTYHFTYDGNNKYQYYQQPLKGIKRLQKNRNVLGDFVTIVEHLKTTFEEFPNNEEVLILGKIATFAVTGGVEDEKWLGRETNE